MTLNNILVGVGFIVVGVVVILLGIRKNMRCSGKAVGRIIGVREEHDTDDDGYNRYTYLPEFEYEVNGQIYHGTGSTRYSNSRKIKIGGSIKVFYNPKKPEENFAKGGGAILPFLGIVAIIIGLVCIYSAF